MGTPRISGFGGREHHALAGCQATSKTGPPATSKTGPPRRCRDVHGVASGWFAVVGSAREERRPEEPRKSPLRRFSRGREGHPGRPECLVRPPPAGGRKGPRVRGGSPLGPDLGVQRHPGGCVVNAFRCASHSGADRRSAFPCLRAALPGGVCAERSATPPLGHAPCAGRRPARADRRSAFPCLRAALPGGVRAEKGAIPTVGGGAAAALRAAVPTGGRRSLACVLLCPVGYVRRGAPHRHWAMRRALAGGQRVPTGGRRSLACVLLCPVGYAPRREPSRRLGAAPPRRCAPRCRPPPGELARGRRSQRSPRFFVSSDAPPA